MKFPIILLTTLTTIFGTISTTDASDLDFLLNRNSKNYDAVIVEKVISADSFVLRDGEKIRLIGLRAPEVTISDREKIERDKYGFPIKQPINPENPIEEQSVHFATQLLEQQTIRLEFDNHKKDDKLFTYAYAFLEDGTFVNSEIIRQGYAWLQISPVNNKYNTSLREAYKEARDNLRGLQSY